MAFALALSQNGQLKRAIDLTQSAVNDSEMLFGPACRLAALNRKSLAELQMQAHDWEAARRNIEQSQSILSGILRPDSPAYLSLLNLRAEIRLRGANQSAESSSHERPTW